MRHALHLGLPALLVCAAVACQESPPATSIAPHAGAPLSASQTLGTAAVVRLVPIEGGCWIFDTPQGSYAPAGLPAPFQVNGLEVYVVMRGAPDLVSLCMIGPLVRIDTIRAR